MGEVDVRVDLRDFLHTERQSEMFTIIDRNVILGAMPNEFLDHHLLHAKLVAQRVDECVTEAIEARALPFIKAACRQISVVLCALTAEPARRCPRKTMLSVIGELGK